MSRKVQRNLFYCNTSTFPIGSLIGAIILVICIIVILNACSENTSSGNSACANIQTTTLDQLPSEAQTTIDEIKKGGPFPYAEDGTEFENREECLPIKPAEYYREYTVPTPGASTRGVQRIVTGSNGEIYYTGDHYHSFQKVIDK